MNEELVDDRSVKEFVQYLEGLAVSHLKKIYGEVHGAETVKRFQEQFAKRSEDVMSRPVDPLWKHHAVNPCFVIALREVQEISISSLEEQVVGIYRVLLQPFFDRHRQEVAASTDPWASIVESVKAGNQQYYDNDYFSLKMVLDTDAVFGFDLHRCLYCELFRDFGYSELAPVLCKYDKLYAETLEDWVSFERTGTIADGADLCDFRFHRK